MTLRVLRIDGFSVSEEGDDRKLFAAGSISKAVTALLALLLVDDGMLDLDAQVHGTTLRQLLGHTSGAGIEFFPGYDRDAVVSSFAELRARVPFDPAAAGSFRYSGGGYLVVQSLLEDATGLPFAALAEARVLAPLGMRDSTFEQPLPAELHERAARDDWRVYPETAAVGLWTTPADLARFAMAIQSALAGRPSPVPRAVAQSMVEPHAELPASDDFEAMRGLGLAPPEAVGLGLFLSDGGRRFGHLGGAYGFTSAIDVSAVDGSGAVAMSDIDNGFAEVLPALACALAEGVLTP
jgi:CubicO group peptidase (beta-lactamase class C family)